MSPSEIAFLALGLVLGAAIGAAIVEAVGSRPAPRREVRLTIAPNSISSRQNTTLADARRSANRVPIPGSPEDGAWQDLRPASTGLGLPIGAMPVAPAPMRTPVSSAPVALPATAVPIPVQPARPQPGPAAGSAAPVGAPASPPAAVPASPQPAVPSPTGDPQPAPVGRVAVLEHARRPAPLGPSPTGISPNAVGVVAPAEPGPRLQADRDAPASGTTARPAAAAPRADPSADPCGSLRTLVDERCAVATSAREHAHAVADALRDAQRAYDEVRERAERAQAQADPREVAAAKEALHRAFRAASGGGVGAEATERAAREWLDQINDLNNRTREARRMVEHGTAELRARLPSLERLEVEADAARISAESAELACREAREALAACEEPSAEAALVAAARSAGAPAWPASVAPPPESGTEGEPGDTVAETLIARILRGDRVALDRLVASLAEDDPELARQWRVRLAQLVDAIGARAIEDGYLDLPDDEPFWGLFAARERREIVGALSALGFRFDGLGGFTDDRVPATRDLSLAVGYAGLDRMRIRAWPRESDLPELFARASVAGAEWLADQAGDLSLGEMVDALGARAGELADLWNAWGRLRPALQATVE